MPSCKDICETKITKKPDEFDEDEDDYSRSNKSEDRSSQRRRKVSYDKYNFMGGYVTGGMPGVCTAETSCMSGASAPLPPGLPPYMTRGPSKTGADTTAEENRPRLHYDLEPVLMDLYAVAAKQQKAGTTGREITKVIDVTSNANILNQTNQDIFTTPPRAGGFIRTYQPQEASHMAAFDICKKCANMYEAEVRHSISKRSNPSLLSSGELIHPSSRGTMSREFRIKRALEESDWETTAVDETDTVVGISDPFHLGMNMLAVTITCVMMMASKMDVTKEYLEWAEGYLKCIKDENGKLPRNINGLLKEIKRRQGKIQDREEKEKASRKEVDAVLQSDSVESVDKASGKSGKKDKKGKSGAKPTHTKGKGPDTKSPDAKSNDATGHDAKGAKGHDAKGGDAKGHDAKSPEAKNATPKKSDTKHADAKKSDTKHSDKKDADNKSTDSKTTDPKGSKKSGSKSPTSTSDGEGKANKTTPPKASKTASKTSKKASKQSVVLDTTTSQSKSSNASDKK